MHPRLRFLVLLLLAFGSAETMRAAETEKLLQEGEAALRAATTGQAGAPDQAFAAFEAVLQAEPQNASARAGRGLALIAQALVAPMRNKLALARRGCADLDAAVAAEPENHAVRLMRATSAVQMPMLLERGNIAEADFARLLAAARDTQITMTAETRRGIFYQAAAFALKERRTGAVELLEQAASIHASEPSDEQVQSMLALARRQLTSPTHADRHPTEKGPASRP